MSDSRRRQACTGKRGGKHALGLGARRLRRALGRQKKKSGPGSVEPAPIAPPEGTNMVPPRLARKMSVLSVDPPAPWAPGQIAAGRAHRPGSRRLGGVEAPGASPATGASWPDRRKGWASPGRGPVLRSHAWVRCRLRTGGPEFLEVVKSQLGPGLVLLSRPEAWAIGIFRAPAPMRCCPFFG